MNKSKGNQDGETLACLIIDDPLLRPQYGCIDYTELLREMKEHRFFTEIAFIPWNYRRSHPDTIRLFIENPEHYAICVHGCDHVKNEFGESDVSSLRNKAQTALWRMEEHRKITGLPYDRVFVPPQGRFSSVAMEVLRSEGFHAVFNSSLEATDTKPPSDHFQTPACEYYSDLPLFLRRYPTDREGFRRDLDNGRPILIVQHHGDFIDGYGEITSLVDWINSHGNVRWCSLNQMVEKYSAKEHICGSEEYMPSVPSEQDSLAIALRRYLSEFRDNWVETNPVLARAYKKIRGN